MAFQKKIEQTHLLFHRPTPWDSEINCSTKIFARLFAKIGYRVTYLQSSIHIGHSLLRKGYYETWRRGPGFSDRIWVAGGRSIIPYLDWNRFLAWLTGRASYLTCIPGLVSLILASGYGSPDLIWTTIPGSSVLKRLFPKARLIFHVIDNYAAYRGNGVSVLEARDYQEADHIFVIGEALRKYVIARYDVPEMKISNLGQGVDLTLYSGVLDMPADLREIPGPIAIWVGLGKKIDPGYLRTAARQMRRRGGSTVLIGPGFESLEQAFEQEENVYFLGPKARDEIPSYLRSSDLGLMLYNRENQHYYEDQHPLKLYEYAAAGLPTISTPHNEYGYLGPPVLVVASERELEQAIDRAFLDYAELRMKMYGFAQSHSWDRCLMKAQECIRQMAAQSDPGSRA